MIDFHLSPQPYQLQFSPSSVNEDAPAGFILGPCLDCCHMRLQISCSHTHSRTTLAGQVLVKDREDGNRTNNFDCVPSRCRCSVVGDARFNVSAAGFVMLASRGIDFEPLVGGVTTLSLLCTDSAGLASDQLSFIVTVSE
jgi:hypothetical protein